MDSASQSACRKNCWLAGLAGGVLVAAMLLFVAKQAFLASVLFGAVIAVLLAFFFLWAFCTASAEPVIPSAEARPAREEAAPAPPPVAPPSPPAPEPAVPARAAAPEPVAAPEASAAPAAVAFAAPERAPEKPAAVKPKAPAKAKKPAAEAPKAAPKPRTGSALDAALAKSREPVAKAGPELLTAPRGGKPDDLKLIKGVGPKLEKLMNEVGVWHFDQIASWKAKDIAIVDAKMDGFKGRISRDEWVKQAKVLARGGSTEFSERAARRGGN
jgi:NADH-quinone oxidoreductase subunit E